MKKMYPFLEALAANNNRPWFEENKAWYEEARKEAENILGNCISEIGKFEDLGLLKPKETMYRIYRDVRFSKNKDPYKRNFSGLISRDGRKQNSVYGYYVHFESGNNFMAAGLYEPTPEQLSQIRQEIDYNSQQFKLIVQEADFVKTFGGVQGNQLKTAPKGYPKDHPDIEWLRFTQYYCSCPFSNEEVLSSGFPQMLADRCKKLRPFLEFLSRSLGQY
jgi:uncharacterized protein (TIGR02453 family)